MENLAGLISEPHVSGPPQIAPVIWRAKSGWQAAPQRLRTRPSPSLHATCQLCGPRVGDSADPNPGVTDGDWPIAPALRNDFLRVPPSAPHARQTALFSRPRELAVR